MKQGRKLIRAERKNMKLPGIDVRSVQEREK